MILEPLAVFMGTILEDFKEFFSNGETLKLQTIKFLKNVVCTSPRSV